MQIGADKNIWPLTSIVCVLVFLLIPLDWMPGENLPLIASSLRTMLLDSVYY